MTDFTAGELTRPHDWASAEAQLRVKKRYRWDRLLQTLGLTAIGLAILMLGILITSLIATGYTAFSQSRVTLEVTLDRSDFDPSDPGSGNYRLAARNAFASYFPDVDTPAEQRKLFTIMSSQAQYVLRRAVISDPGLIGQTFSIGVPLSDPYDQLYKGVIPRQIEALSLRQTVSLSILEDAEAISVEDGRTFVRIEATIPDSISSENPEAGPYPQIAQDALRRYFEVYPQYDYRDILNNASYEALKDYVVANPNAIGTTVQIVLPASPFFDEYYRTGSSTILNPRFSSPEELQYFDSLIERGLLSQPFNWDLFINADSRFPEVAGLAGAIAGSFFALLICFLISFPVGIAAAVYLEEFAPKNRWTDFIEVNINNLAAVPSVVFGLLGLAVFLGFFGLTRSAPLVGGMVLSLMTLPTIIITTRAALKAVPPSIREAALSIGASRHQVVMHHVLPLAMPGILTGTIIGLAQALGETAPLLLIGMNAFIPSVEAVGILEPATALPTQIYSWADSPERGFVARTSAAILVLLGFLVVMNGIAIYLRQRFQRRW